MPKARWEINRRVVAARVTLTLGVLLLVAAMVALNVMAWHEPRGPKNSLSVTAGLAIALDLLIGLPVVAVLVILAGTTVERTVEMAKGPWRTKR